MANSPSVDRGENLTSGKCVAAAAVDQGQDEIHLLQPGTHPKCGEICRRVRLVRSAASDIWTEIMVLLPCVGVCALP